MKQLLLSLLLVCATLFNGNAQIDSIFKSSIEYYSDFEKAAFEKYIGGDTNDLDQLMLAIDKDMTDDECRVNWDKAEEFFKKIEPKVNKKKSINKKISYIFNSIHDEFFVKYEIVASIDQIFSTGTYNCLSASAFYAKAFDYFNIPYDIKSQPAHIYLIADPNGIKRKIESTDPIRGYYSVDKRIKKAIVNQLLDNKLITQDEVELKGHEAIYEEIFLSDKTITMNQLIGLQYYNDGIKAFEAEEYETAFNQLKKSFIIYPDGLTRSMLIVALANIVDNYDYDNIEEIKGLILFYQLYDFDDLDDEFKNDFLSFTNEVLIRNSDTAMYKQIYHEFMNATTDSTLLAEISFVYFYEMGRALLLLHKYKEGMDFLLYAYQYNPEHIHLRSMLFSVIGEQVFRAEDHEIGLKLMDEYLEKYPFLEGTEFMDCGRCLMYLIGMADLFDYNEEEEALEFQKKFEEAYSDGCSILIKPQIIEAAYKEAWAYYSRKRKDEEANKMVEKGLQYVPDSDVLKRVGSY